MYFRHEQTADLTAVKNVDFFINYIFVWNKYFYIYWLGYVIVS